MDKKPILEAIRRRQKELGLTDKECGERMKFTYQPGVQWWKIFYPKIDVSWARIEAAANTLGLELTVTVEGLSL